MKSHYEHVQPRKVSRLDFHCSMFRDEGGGWSELYHESCRLSEHCFWQCQIGTSVGTSNLESKSWNFQVLEVVGEIKVRESKKGAHPNLQYNFHAMFNLLILSSSSAPDSTLLTVPRTSGPSHSPDPQTT
jgi:hypothetical protein